MKQSLKKGLNHSHGTVGQKTLEENLLMGRSKTLTIFISYQNFNIFSIFRNKTILKYFYLGGYQIHYL